MVASDFLMELQLWWKCDGEIVATSERMEVSNYTSSERTQGCLAILFDGQNLPKGKEYTLSVASASIASETDGAENAEFSHTFSVPENLGPAHLDVEDECHHRQNQSLWRPLLLLLGDRDRTRRRAFIHPFIVKALLYASFQPMSHGTGIWGRHVRRLGKNCASKRSALLPCTSRRQRTREVSRRYCQRGSGS